MTKSELVVPKKSTSLPYLRDKYYVYALFKPSDINPFYIGKGINNRVNHHFAEWSLSDNNRKNKTIKKYGNSIRREILCYFDSEDSAYSFEEYLISLYKLANEGGCLYNVAKSRHDIPEVRKQAITTSNVDRVRVYSEQDVVMLYTNYFQKRLSYLDSICGTDIPLHYSYTILNGKKFKGLYEKYISSGLIPNLREPSDNQIKVKIKRKLTDEEVLSAFDKVCSGDMTLIEVAKEFNVGKSTLSVIFRGKDRTYLNLNLDRYKTSIKGNTLQHSRRYSEFTRLYAETKDVHKIAETMGVHVASVYNYLLKYRQEMEDEDVPQAA